LHKLTFTGIATLVAAVAFASNAAAAIDKPGPGFLGLPVPAPVAPKPGLTAPVKPTLTSPQPVRIPAF
jgi:hypothetical protein